MRKFLLIFATFALMVVCGAGAYVMAVSYLMHLGLKLHGNYEYYGSTPAIALIFVAGAMGFAAPGVVVWYLWNIELSWRFSLRTLLIAITLIAVVLGLIAVSI